MVSILCIHLQYICMYYVYTHDTVLFNTFYSSPALLLACYLRLSAEWPAMHIFHFLDRNSAIVSGWFLSFFYCFFSFFLFCLVFRRLLFFGRVGALLKLMSFSPVVVVVFVMSMYNVYMCDTFFGGSYTRSLLYFVRSSAVATDAFFHCF